jgi:hypothetical protein
MAKSPRSNKSSFGKRSDAEKTFRNNRSSNRSGRGEFDSGRSRSFSTRPSRFDKPEGESKSFTRRDDTEKPKRASGPFERRGGDFGSDRPKRFTGTGFNKRDDGERKSFRRDSFDGEKPKRFGDDTNRDERPKRFERIEGGSSFGRKKFDTEKPKLIQTRDQSVFQNRKEKKNHLAGESLIATDQSHSHDLRVTHLTKGQSAFRHPKKVKKSPFAKSANRLAIDHNQKSFRAKMW